MRTVFCNGGIATVGSAIEYKAECEEEDTGGGSGIWEKWHAAAGCGDDGAQMSRRWNGMIFESAEGGGSAGGVDGSRVQELAQFIEHLRGGRRRMIL